MCSVALTQVVSVFCDASLLSRVSGVQKKQEEIASEMVALVRESIGPVAAFRKVLFVKALPKTRSGKIPRSSLANLVNGKPYKVRVAHYSHPNKFSQSLVLQGKTAEGKALFIQAALADPAVIKLT